MPKRSSYRQASKSLGGYKKSLYDLQSKEHEMDYNKYELDEKVKLYENVGTTAANVLGLIKEGQLLKQQNKYAERAKDFAGIEARTSTEKTFWGGDKDVTKYFNKKTGDELTMADLSGIGRLEAYGVNTGYNPVLDKPERPAIPILSGEVDEMKDMVVFADTPSSQILPSGFELPGPTEGKHIPGGLMPSDDVISDVNEKEMWKQFTARHQELIDDMIAPGSLHPNVPVKMNNEAEMLGDIPDAESTAELMRRLGRKVTMNPLTGEIYDMQRVEDFIGPYNREDKIVDEYVKQDGPLFMGKHKKESDYEFSEARLVEDIYKKITRAETGSFNDPYIRTTLAGSGSSAYGPAQMTKTLAQEYLNKGPWTRQEKDYLYRFIEQGENFLRYGGGDWKNFTDMTEESAKQWEYGGSGNLTSDKDKAMYENVTKKIMGKMLKNYKGKYEDFWRVWRFGATGAKDMTNVDEGYKKRYRG